MVRVQRLLEFAEQLTVIVYWLWEQPYGLYPEPVRNVATLYQAPEHLVVAR